MAQVCWEKVRLWGFREFRAAYNLNLGKALTLHLTHVALYYPHLVCWDSLVVPSFG